MNSSNISAIGKLLIVGGGTMGRAICAGLLKSGSLAPDQICVANPGDAKRASIAHDYHVATVADAREGLPADIIVLAVKPAVTHEVAAELAQAGIDGALVVSIAAGVSTDSLSRCMGADVPIVRVMPNTPLVCGDGVAGVSGGAAAGSEDVGLACAIFESVGSTVVVDESEQDVVTALSGSGPAYFELMVESMARSGERLGLAYDKARELALKTMLGTARLIDETGQDLPSAIEAVSTPGGTTAAALAAMREAGFVESVDAGVRAAARRSAELGA